MPDPTPVKNAAEVRAQVQIIPPSGGNNNSLMPEKMKGCPFAAAFGGFGGVDKPLQKSARQNECEGQ